MSTKVKKVQKRKSMLVQMDPNMFKIIQKKFETAKKKKSGPFSRNVFMNDELQKHFGGDCKAVG